MTSRPFVAVVVGVVHVALIVQLLVLTKRSHLAAQGSLASTILVFLPPAAAPVGPARPPKRDTRRARDTSSSAPVPLTVRVSPTPSSAITMPDWYQGAGAAAAAQVMADEDKARQAASMGQAAVAARSRAEAPVKSGPDFAWSKARTQRIERTEDGATILRLNDRCVLVNFILPFCRLEKEKARGDLFEGMKEPAELGDWKD